MKKAIAIITYARYHYFQLVFPSIISQIVKGKKLLEQYDIYIFQDGLWEDESDENKKGHSYIGRMLESLYKPFAVFQQADNLGIALHFDFIEKFLFLDKQYDFAIFCEDDLILAPGYINALDAMSEKFLDDPRVGMIGAHPANCRVNLETQRSKRHKYAPMGHNWGFGISRSFWKCRQPFVECYLDLIRDKPYRGRPHDVVYRWLEFSGFRSAASSQDYIKQCATAALGACRLSTYPNFGLPIGRSGVHCRPEIFKEMGFDQAVVYDGELETVGELDQDQFDEIYLNDQLAVSKSNSAAFSSPRDRAEWIRKLNAGQLHPGQMKNLEELDKPLSANKVWLLSEIPDSPHMEPEGRACFEERLREANIYLEYGVGGSTIFASFFEPKEIHSVDSDKLLIRAVQQLLEERKVSINFKPHFIDIGQIKEWGWPIDNSRAVAWPNYCVAPWIGFNAAGTSPDLILIDGRFRVACFLCSILFSKSGTKILFDDYFDRPHYYKIEKHVSHCGRAGRMAEFVVPAAVDAQAILIDLLPSIMDPA